MKASVTFRSKKKKLLVPEEGEDWKAAQESEETTRAIDAARVVAFHSIAKEHLASYCRLNSISDAECQRIADRITYEHSEKNHLRNPKPLKSVMDLIKAAPKINDAVYDKLKQERSKATDAEFARLQAKAKAESKQAADVPEGWRELFDDELDGRWIEGAKFKSEVSAGRNWRFAETRDGGAFADRNCRIIVPIVPSPPVKERASTDLKIRRRITP